MQWRDAVQANPGGVRLLLEVTAGAKDPRFPDGFNPWRDGRIGIRVRSPAQDGKANQEVLATVARFFSVRSDDVVLLSGATDSRKSLLVRNLALTDALKALAVHLDDRP